MGNVSHQWKELWVSGNTIYINGTPISINSNNQLTVGNVSGGSYQLASEDYVVAAISSIPAGPRGNIGPQGIQGNVGPQGEPGSSANTGDLAFVSDAMYNLAGVIVENADLTTPATASLILPTNGATGTGSDVQLNNSYSNVVIGTGTSSTLTNFWTFGADGKLTFPDGNTRIFHNPDNGILNFDSGVDGGGGNNTASLIMSGSNSVGIKSDGASNTYTVNQNGINSLSIGGYAAGDSMVGNGNTVTVGQTGNNTMALGMTGNTNTVSVTQNNTTSDSNILNLRINGNSNTTTINQSNHN